MQNGMRVVATRDGQRDYNTYADAERQARSGEAGEIVNHSDSHGLTYEVRFDGGRTAWFDPDELSAL